MKPDDILKSLSVRSTGRRLGIGTAEFYIASVSPCIDGNGLCPVALFGEQGKDLWSKELDQSKTRLTYCDDEMMTKGLKTSGLSDSKLLAEFDLILTSTSRDRDGDILETKGANIDLKMPLLWQHLHVQPLGPFLKLHEHTETIAKGSAGIAATKFGEDIVKLVESGALRISHGFRPTDFEPLEIAKGVGPNGEDVVLGWHVKTYDMVEVSLVSVPSNKDAVITAFRLQKLHDPLVKSWAERMWRERPVVTPGVNQETRKALTDDSDPSGSVQVPVEFKNVEEIIAKQIDAAIEKKVVPYQGGEVRKGTWDATAAKKRLENWSTAGGKLSYAKYRQAFAWYDESNAETLGAYKLPHHDIANGQLVVHRQGVISAMAALLGARGGVEIPEAERKGVYNHLAKHYRNDLDMDPPEYKDVADYGLKTVVSRDPLVTKMLGMDSHFLEGSWEWVESKLIRGLRAYLIGKEVDDVDEYTCCYLVGTFPDHAIACVDPWSDKNKRCFSIDWGMKDEMPVWTGEPKEVQIKASIIEKTLESRFGTGLVSKAIRDFADSDGLKERLQQIKDTLRLVDVSEEDDFALEEYLS